MYESISTKNKKFGLPMYLVERTLLVSHKLYPYFWSKKQAEKFDLLVYSKTTNLNRIFGCLKKKFSDEILLNTFNKFKPVQIKKICDLVRWPNNIGRIIATITIYCNEEVERQKRLASPKDDGIPDAIIFNPGKDLRTKKILYRKNIWQFLGG